MTNQPVRGGGRARAAHRLAEARSAANADTRGPEAPSIQRLGALRLGVTCRRSGEWTQREMARGAVWRAYPTGALPSRSPQGLGTPGGPQWGYGEAGGRDTQKRPVTRTGREQATAQAEGRRGPAGDNCAECGHIILPCFGFLPREWALLGGWNWQPNRDYLRFTRIAAD